MAAIRFTITDKPIEGVGVFTTATRMLGILAEQTVLCEATDAPSGAYFKEPPLTDLYVLSDAVDAEWAYHGPEVSPEPQTKRPRTQSQ